MNDKTFSTAPKPFVFVLMPFDKEFDDIYFLGIKETAKEVGAYAERVDEQIFTEGILERVFNQINKADVIVADMTGRNPNVFYEVGYAHALGKVVLLLTQKVDDIPFDLKHRQHFVYGNDGSKIQNLRKELTPGLIWAINESLIKRREKKSNRILVSISGEGDSFKEIICYNKNQEICLSESIPIIKLSDGIYSNKGGGMESFAFRFHILNNSSEEIPIITHIYLFLSEGALLLPEFVFQKGHTSQCELAYNPEKDNRFPVKYFLRTAFSPMPSGATEAFTLSFWFTGKLKSSCYKLRIHDSNDYYDFPFMIEPATNET